VPETALRPWTELRAPEVPECRDQMNMALGIHSGTYNQFPMNAVCCVPFLESAFRIRSPRFGVGLQPKKPAPPSQSLAAPPEVVWLPHFCLPCQSFKPKPGLAPAPSSDPFSPRPSPSRPRKRSVNPPRPSRRAAVPEQNTTGNIPRHWLDPCLPEPSLLHVSPGQLFFPPSPRRELSCLRSKHL